MSEWERSRRVIKGGQNHSVEREREREEKQQSVGKPKGSEEEGDGPNIDNSISD